MRQIHVPPSQLQLKVSDGPPGSQAHGMDPVVEHEGVPGVHDPYGSMMSIGGYDTPFPGHAESPHATGQVVGARGVL